MTEAPIPGVTYWCDPDNARWSAPSRPDLPWVVTPLPPDPIIFAGSATIGTTAYAMPATGVVFCAPLGSPGTNAGTLANPYLGAQRAITAAADGSTIVMRAGVYHEKLTTPQGKSLTMQAYPHEAVWFDGSSTYSAWTANGNNTWTTAYAVTFARFSGANAGTNPYRNYPDQVWVNDVPLTQVADATTPGPGQFSVNQTADTLTIGTSPVGKTVKVSDLDLMLVASGALDLYGIGVRRYSPQSMGYLNAMIYWGGSSSGTVMENCVFQESSMAAMSVTMPDITIRSCTVQLCGWSGIVGTTCDRSLVEKSLIKTCNQGGWSAEPETSAIKWTRTDGVVWRDNYITGVPNAYGMWLDVSNTRFTIANNVVDGGGTMVYGIEAEESDGGKINGIQYNSYVIGNKVLNCAAGGIRILCTGYTVVANNDVRRNNIGIYGQQDRPGNSGTNPANKPADVCPWITRENQYLNNIMDPAGNPTGSYNIQFQTYDNGPKTMTGIDQIARYSGNWHGTNPSGGSVVQLGKIGGLRTTYNTMAALAAADSTVGGPWGPKLGTNVISATAPAVTIADPLTAVMASYMRMTEGDQIIGPNVDKLPVPIS